MAKLAGLHYWIGTVLLAFFAASAAAAQDQDIFDLFVKQPKTKAAPQAESVQRPRPNSEHMRRHEGGDSESIFGLFIPYDAPRVESRRAPRTSSQATAPAKNFAPPTVSSTRETKFTPRLAVIVKPRSVVAAPQKAIPEPPAKPARATPVKPRPRPVLQPAQEARKYDCEQARAIIGKYAFGHVQAKSCEGEVYSFAAERSGKPFLIKISALNGELVEVKRASD
jgi:hypothetical protein